MLPGLKKNLEFNAGTSYPAILLLICLLPFAGNAQIYIRHYTSATDTFYWKRYTHVPQPPAISLKRCKAPGSAKKTEFFIARHGSEFRQFTDDPTQRLSLKDLEKHLLPVDINGDRLADMIFQGPGQGASDIVRIWLNRRDSFELVFEDYQYISKFRKAGDTLVEIETADVGLSGDYLYFTRNYRVERDHGDLVFVKGKQTVVYKYTEEPQKYYPRPVPFISIADTLLLRASPQQLNEPFIPRLGTFGNIVAKYRSRSAGFALAYKSYGKGSDWYFVEFSPSATPSASILYDIDKIPTFIRGWVSGQAIELR